MAGVVLVAVAVAAPFVLLALDTADKIATPAPSAGVLPLAISALRSSALVLGNPANRRRAVPLT